jgi:hypothetical protein
LGIEWIRTKGRGTSVAHPRDISGRSAEVQFTDPSGVNVIMFGLKKIVPAIAALVALSIPSLALADDHGRREVRRDDRAVAELRAEIARDKLERARDTRMHRWGEARRERREIERHEQQLRRLLGERR